MQTTKIFGPPGTGKTYSLLQIMERELAKGIKPDRLAYLTFTVQARKEALKRVEEKFGYTPEELPNFRTLHAICYRELNMTVGGMVKGNKDLRSLGEMLGVEFTVKERHVDADMMDFPSGGELGDRLLQLDHVRRHNLQALDDAWVGRFDDDVNIFQARRFVRAYEQWKQREGLRDFTDLLEQAEDPLDIDVVIVDEAQDLSKLQWLTLHRLCRNATRMYLAGDDDQAIFTWAGADPRSFIDHPGDVVVLEQSYRLPHAVAQVARTLAERITYRQPKTWRARDAAGTVRFRQVAAGLDFIQPGSHLCLYRHHYQAADLEEEVRALGRPYTRNDRPAPGAEWGHAIIYWERFRKGKETTWREMRQVVEALAVHGWWTLSARKQFLSMPKDALFHTSTQTLFPSSILSRPWFDILTRILPADGQYLRTIIRHHGSSSLTSVPLIRLSTIHAAKGAEADHVVLLTDVSRRVRETMEVRPDDERRVFYVGVSRAKETLTLVGADNPLF